MKKSALNRHQKKFFRRLRANPAGLPEAEWPAATVVQRWMRQRLFRRRLEAIQSLLRWQADYQSHLAVAAATSDLRLDGTDPPERVAEAIRLQSLLHGPDWLRLPPGGESARMAAT